MRVPFSTQIIAPMWIMGVGIVAGVAPPPRGVIGLFLLLSCVVVVPAMITRLLWKPCIQPSRQVVSLHSIPPAR